MTFLYCTEKLRPNNVEAFEAGSSATRSVKAAVKRRIEFKSNILKASNYDCAV